MQDDEESQEETLKVLSLPRITEKKGKERQNRKDQRPHSRQNGTREDNNAVHASR